MQIAFDAIWFYKRARLVATNPDRYCPMPGRRGEPDAAAITAAIEACTNTKCEAIVGKPDPAMVYAALHGLNVDLSNCVMVGDRLSTDIKMAFDTQMDAALVLTGETTVDDLALLLPEDMPNFILDRIDQLLPPQLWEEVGWTDNS